MFTAPTLYREDKTTVITVEEISTAICAGLLDWLDNDFSNDQLKRPLPPVTVHGNVLPYQRIKPVVAQLRKLPVNERKLFLENDCTELRLQVSNWSRFVH
jgi:hypothetical protein